MANGIDQEIQSKVDAYRGNPQALQQRYAQNQQLVDLLALQKLKSEKEAAAREMQMQMQQQPQTIKQQREAELLGMTKQEMMKQTQGILQQRQAEQQKNMQRVAQGGIGALAGQRPAAPQQAPQGQPMPRMAGGGIVAFQEGGITEADLYNLTPDALAQIRRTDPERYRAIRNELARRQRESASDYGMYGPTSQSRTDTDAVARAGRQDPSLVAQGLQALKIGDSPNLVPGAVAPRPMQGPTPLGPETFAPGFERQGPEDFAFGIGADATPRTVVPSAAPTDMGPSGRGGRRGPEVAAEAVEDATTPSGIASLGEYVAKTGLGGGSADAAMQRGFQAADAYTGRAEKAGRFADMEAELRAFDEATYDPTEDRRDQLKAFLAGTANTTNFGATMAGGTVASLNLRRKQKAERRDRLKDIFAMAERGMDLDATLASGGLKLGQQMYADAMANQRAALQAATSMRNEDLRAATERAKLEYQQLKDDRQFGLDERELNIEEAYNAAQVALTAEQNDTQRFTAVSSALDRIQGQELAVHEYVVENSQLPDLQEKLYLTQDPDEIARLEAAIAAEEAEVAIKTETIFDNMGGVEARDTLAAELLNLTNTGATMLSREDVTAITKE
jgi:hypothetical protein